LQFCCSGRMCTWDLRMSLANGHSSRKASLFSSIAMLSSSIKWYGCRIVLPWDKYLQFMAAKSSFYQNTSSNKQTNKQTAVANTSCYMKKKTSCVDLTERGCIGSDRGDPLENFANSPWCWRCVSVEVSTTSWLYILPAPSVFLPITPAAARHVNSTLSKSPTNPQQQQQKPESLQVQKLSNNVVPTCTRESLNHVSVHNLQNYRSSWHGA
jgi:hypothetical protein